MTDFKPHFTAKSHQPRKRFGQNFLHDANIIAQIVAAVGLKRDDKLVEIGPGMGALTEPLLAEVNAMTVIELDYDLASTLRMRIGAHSHTSFNIIEANAMAVDYRKLYQTWVDEHKPSTEAQTGSSHGRLRIVGNLPYNISTPLLFHLLQYSDVIEDMHFMLQKEVVDRITAEVGSKAYGRLSVMMQYYCQAQYLLTVPKGAFNPPPKVTSAVFRLMPWRQKPVACADEALFAVVVRECFNHRRKTLRAIFKKNALLPALSSTDFAQIELSETARPETLSVADFVALTNVVKQKQQPVG